MNNILTIPNSLRKTAALLAIVSLLATSLPIGVLTAQAARTGATVAVQSSDTAEVNTQIPLTATVTDDGNPTPAVQIVLDDGGQGGIFSNASGSTCTTSLGAGPQQLTVNANTSNKNFCYTNSTPGTYTISVQAKTGANLIGSPDTVEVTLTSAIVSVPTPILTAEEFITHNGFIGGGAEYKGISVGFRTEDFGTATAVSVTIERADGSTVTKTANQGVLDIINQDTSGGDQLTTPFVIEEGTFTEASDIQYWNPAPATWNINTRPVEVTITVTDESGDTTVTNSTFNDGAPSWPTYESLLPPLVVSACTMPTTLHTSDLSTWDLSETRATGHNQLTFDGLRIWTEGNTTTDKAAGYYTTNFPLYDLGNQTISEALDYEASFGIEPGLQLVVDFDNDGNIDGILVGESTYGNNWWLTNSSAQFVKDNAPNTGGGNGSNWFGTPDEWLVEFPNAQVKAIGYSLGSGIHGDGVIKNINLGCTVYTFGLLPSEITSPATDGEVVSGTTTLAAFYSDENGDNNDGVQWAVRANTCASGAGAIFGNVGGRSDAFNWDHINFTADFDTNSVANGTYCFVFNPSEDSGDTDQRLTRLFTVDNAPLEAPEHLSPEDEAVQNFNDFYFDWTDVDGAVEYEFQSSQDPTVDGDGALVNGVWNNRANGAPDRHYLTESEIHSYGANGTWYWQVRSIDTYGNMSDWTEPWMLTIDMVAPSSPQITHPVDEQIFSSAPILNEWTVATDNDGIDYYQIAYRYDDGHTFGGTTCPDVTIDGDWVGCRDVNGTSRNHSPSLAEQGGVTIWVRAFDNAGNASDWSDSVHYYYYVSGELPVDEAPAVPTGLGWNDSNGGPVADGGTTDLVSGKALWATNTEIDFSHYIYKYWNNISTSAYNSTSSAWTTTTSNNELPGSFNQGEGTHYFCIIAVDNAGNESDCSDEFTVIYDTDSPEPTSNTNTQTITGNTAVGENQPGWLFNRDTNTQSPYEFVLGTSTVGTGSLYINPITNSINGNNDKFIAELFLLSPIAELDSLSYDFNIAAVDATDENEFYMSVYANFGSSSSTKFYDCRYSVVPTVGVVGGWTTVTFDPSLTYPVTTRTGGEASPFTCPASPAGMDILDSGSTIRAIALNVGDTSVNDQGVSGYFDNVVVVQTTGLHTETTIYDFEPATTTPTEETTETGGGGGGGGGGNSNNNDDGPVSQVAGASTDSEMYQLLEEIKNRLAEFLLASYVSAQEQTGGTGGSTSGAVLGDSIAQDDAQLPQEDEENTKDEEEDTKPTVDENEKSGAVMDISWQNYYWLLVLLWLLSSAGALWRRNEFPETIAMRAVQGTFATIALLLLAGSIFFGLIGAFWPALIVTIGAITAYFWSIE